MMEVKQFNFQYNGFQFKIYDASFKAYKKMPSGKWKMIKYRDGYLNGKRFESDEVAKFEARKYIDTWKPSMPKKRGGHPFNPFYGRGNGEWDFYAHTADDL